MGPRARGFVGAAAPLLTRTAGVRQLRWQRTRPGSVRPPLEATTRVAMVVCGGQRSLGQLPLAGLRQQAMVPAPGRRASAPSGLALLSKRPVLLRLGAS